MILAAPRLRPGIASALRALFALSFLAGTALAQGEEAEYRRFPFLVDSRTALWVVAELHLMFGAFVLGVPLFALLVEYIGVRTKDERYDRLAKEFTKLLSAAFATTAALGGLQAFLIFGLFPKFARHWSDVFHTTFYLYAGLFFVEAFALYSYYYAWEKLKHRKGIHMALGVVLNVAGIALMVIANSWATYMMGPPGVTPQGERLASHWDAAGNYIGPLRDAFFNTLWNPLNIHRLVANITFGGLVVGAYAAVKFLGAKNAEERAHYDWMGYVGNFVAIAAMLGLPFAGYYFGREVYGVNPSMGLLMMGGGFSWAFIIQAILIAIVFIGGNYYLWLGMGRIAGAERYQKYIPWINAILFVCFAVWVTPHNLPLSGEERAGLPQEGHPFVSKFGVMVAKNAVVQLVILSTFVSFLMYRRANKGERVPFSKQGKAATIVLALVALACLWFLNAYRGALAAEALPERAEEAAKFATAFGHLKALLLAQMVAIVVAFVLTVLNRGILAQGLLLGATVFSAVIWLWWGIGYWIFKYSNPVLRQTSVTQVLIVLACIVMTTAIDVYLWRGAKSVGGIAWGKMPIRSQYVLVLVCITVVLLMGLMGFIRSGLRESWHVMYVLRDTSETAFTPSFSSMARVVSVIVVLFLGLITFVFWLAGLGEEKKNARLPTPVAG